MCGESGRRVALGHGDPHIEGSGGHVHSQPESVEAWHEHVSSLLVEFSQSISQLIVGLNGRDPRFLHCLEDAGIKVALHLAESRQDLLVANGEPDSPAGHIESF